MDEVFVGDVGTEMSLDCEMDISSATVMRIVVKKPNGKRVRWAAQADGTSAIKYVIQAGDLDVAGDWDMQAYVEMPTWSGHGVVTTLKVKNTV